MSATLWPVLHDLTERAVRRFDLPKPKLLPILPRHRDTSDGRAWRSPCQIKLRVHRYRRPNQPLAKSTILATLAHELAHLATWSETPDHGPAWWALTKEIAAWMRAEGHPVNTNLRHGTYEMATRHRRKRKKRRKE